MPKEQVDWVGLGDVVLAADRGLAPLGPEFAGFVVLEAAHRLRELGGGIADAKILAIGTNGHVALTAQPRRADEKKASAALRAVLAALLEVASSSTPALRACARRKEGGSLAALARELEAALVPLNRAASRRGVARVARATVDAIDANLLEAHEEETSTEPEESDPPPAPTTKNARAEEPRSVAAPPKRARVESAAVEAPRIAVAARPVEAQVAIASRPVEAPRPAVASRPVEPPKVAKAAPPPDPTPTPDPVDELPTDVAPPVAIEPTPAFVAEARIDESPAFVAEARIDESPAFVAEARIDESPAFVAEARIDESKGYVAEARVVEAPPVAGEDSNTKITAAAPFDAEAELGSAEEGDIEIVSNLPPIVDGPEGVAPEDDSARSFAVAVDVAARRPRKDRVAELIESFQVSRRRDDPALSRDLKAMVGIETNPPPPVTVHVRLKPRNAPDDDVIAIDHEPPVDAEPPAAPGLSPLRRAIVALSFAALGAALAATAIRPSVLDAVFGPPLPPPGEAAATAATVAAAPALSAPRLPMVCDASLTVEGVAPGSEVLRRLGAMPLVATLPMHVAVDLVATRDGAAPRRARIDASAMWQKDGTAPRMEITFTLDAADGAKWPSATSLAPLRAPSDTPRGLLRASSTPPGATLWVVVDPASITGVPCGAAVDLLIVPPGGSPKPLRVDWSSFSGSPPHATTKI